MKTFSLSDVNMMETPRGVAMYCKFYIDGKHILDFHDYGNGGCPSYNIVRTKEFEEFKKLLDALPELYIESLDWHTKIDVDLFIDLLNDKIEKERLLTKIQKYLV